MADCGLGIIHWCNFDWPSFATLATGFAAVAGAVIVGRKQAGIAARQADISDRQTAILGQQVELETAKLRADLFARRLETYEATANFVLHISALPDTDPEAEERIRRFNVKMRESQFLFSDPNVYRTLMGYWEKGNQARTDRAISFAEHEEGIRHDPERTRRIMDYPSWSFETADGLADLFRHDLSILKGEGGHGDRDAN